ncbi:hypothetical protein HMPREF0731_0874 [Pseudoroseomonas cervicalis ATCC 49957]|uniref:Uncharacterized protein n=1 Tax=Pseudoroseomonas cervicalis ATCC 49957 TaxID=525371 RepID=D5RIG4_9PROT|nr:hypothetical protein HMPREF0731_0874 [Pseudoroseomonas cervicalis ATCC 49957]
MPSRHKARHGQRASRRSTAAGTISVAGPCSAWSNRWLPRLGSRFSSSVSARPRSAATKPAAG